MNAHVVIITGKRIICVDEIRKGRQESGSAGARGGTTNAVSTTGGRDELKAAN